jgi:Fur family ferric uptake transcriptional regulator
LVSIRAVQQVDAGGGPTRYDPNTEDGHHHLVCRKCGDLRDVHPQGLEALELPHLQRFGYRILNREVGFQGYCIDCGGRWTPKYSPCQVRSRVRIASSAPNDDVKHLRLA